MHFEVIGDDNNNEGVRKRMDKKHKVLKKYFADLRKDMNRNDVSGDENSTAVFQAQLGRDMRLDNRENGCLYQECGYGAENRCFPNLHSESDAYQPKADGRIKSELADNFENNSFMPSYFSPEDCAPFFNALKLEPDTNEYSSHILRDRPCHTLDYDMNDKHSDYHGLETGSKPCSTDLSSSYYDNSPYQPNFCHQNMDIPSPSQEYYCGASSSLDARYSDAVSASPYGFSPMGEGHWADEDDGDEPLDLSIPKDEDPSYNNTFDECADSPQSCGSRSEGGETNSWLRKIKTGTRSRVRSPKSWEFLLRLLMDPRSNPSMIKWEDERWGTFRLVQKDEIAKIWGMRSNKHKDGGLSYDNFARNLRYHYKTKMLVPVSEKHLVYRFSNEVMEKRFSIVN